MVNLDAEGHDLEVIEGMRHTLRERRPEFVMVERLATLDMTRLLGVMRDADYETDGLGVDHLAHALGDSRIDGSISNIFCSPQELSERLLSPV